ncbi:hypothetical protein LRB48_00095 [Borreliella burgdorferi]|uniref:hypothetical protein n=1 Tax=Borreliella burgdorferi TaxID=139 RepID=UPI001E4BD869|nr:hypothetical protein [Borreliella burgdorferi]MCD2382863.1 hypothetical protein [Borreliella burgdorferi]MCD2389623.1 hypothetical protein [Borreliella burgdorferi]MCD2394735.1 hypothetical protein [Borreliella burgdorferi]MCD2395537.1 hypothetical protein [Borreliella burgdorferi]MCD2397075.1 hypothetical protein [Borreliella burgdorferi]
MKLPKLYKLILIFLFTTRLFSVKDEKSDNKLELFSNVETKIKKNSKNYDSNSNSKNSKKESILKRGTNSKKNINSNIYIQKSKKINYPNRNLGNNINQKTANDVNFTKTSYVKVYPNYKDDNFQEIKNANKFPAKTEKTHMLIGPILKDNLGIIIKMLKTKGYTLIEYVEDNN